MKYLGCMLNQKADISKELSKRMSEVYVVWKKLEIFWKHSNCSTRQKIIVYDSIIRSKLIYGMEGAQINDHIKKKNRQLST